jgi:hypothetical protein
MGTLGLIVAFLMAGPAFVGANSSGTVQIMQKVSCGERLSLVASHTRPTGPLSQCTLRSGTLKPQMVRL